jgi:hypothetical protein
MPRAFLHFRDQTTLTQEFTMKITLPRIAPRNPLVRTSRFRQAGAHTPGIGARRQKSARELRRELDRLAAKERPPHE